MVSSYFYCPVLGLVVEVDGDVHAGRKAYDTSRDEHLRGRGLIVVRFTNEEVMRETAAVLERLHELTE